MKKQLLTIALLVVSIGFIRGQQTLFESMELDRAYDKKTRSRDGLPAEKYWQNHSQYKISARFQPDESVVTGQLQVAYFNDSPDTLRNIVFKLMQNVYKKGANRQMPVDDILLHNGVQVRNIRCGEKETIAQFNTISPTVANLSLPEALSPKSSITITLEFETPIAKKSGFRSGTIDSTSFFVAYWFPQIAVYDDIFGWDREEYVGVPETYNDFSDYEVQLTLPAEYNVWATGEQLNEVEVFSKEVLERIKKSRKSEEVVHILTEKDFKKPGGPELIWMFRATGVPDFAWGASDHYLWEGMMAKNPDAAHPCWVQSAYPQGAAYFDMVSGIAKKSVELFSNHFPGLPYPYFKHISFRGTEGGGMEFPMLANNDVAHDTVNTVLVTAHELAHNYFPFMMGVNERKFGWWDETITTLMEDFVHNEAYQKYKITGFFDRSVSFNYLGPMHSMVPLITETTNVMKTLPSITNFYVKGPAAIDMLQNLIGKDQFINYNKTFMEAWKGKHPTPWDYFYFFNAKSGRDLNWFWHSWFYSFGYADLEITGVEQTDNYLVVHVNNKGGLPVTFSLQANLLDGSRTNEEFNISIWENDQHEISVRLPVTSGVKTVELLFPGSYDANPDNNLFHLSEK